MAAIKSVSQAEQFLIDHKRWIWRAFVVGKPQISTTTSKEEVFNFVTELSNKTKAPSINDHCIIYVFIYSNEIRVYLQHPIQASTATKWVSKLSDFGEKKNIDKIVEDNYVMLYMVDDVINENHNLISCFAPKDKFNKAISAKTKSAKE